MKRNYQTLILLLTFATLITSCNSYKKYVTASYYEQLSKSTTLAILPVRFTLKGVILEKLDEEQKVKYEEKESLYFQRALAARLVRKMGSGKRQINVNLQDVSITNSKLKEAGYQIHDTYTLNPKELGKILGVDEIMLVDIHSNQLFSEEEAMLLETASAITQALGVNIGTASQIKTGKIEVTASIVDAKNEALLWAKNATRNTRVQKTPDEAMHQLTKALIRAFPFRNEDYR